MPEKIKRIALIGPESSGKTTLSKLLAEHFNTVWVPEYSREYVEKLNRPYTSDDILFMAKEQLAMENSFLAKANKFIFSDTELINAKIWCEDVFGICPAWIDEKIEEKKYDFYLLTKPDLVWQPDPVRENPHRREYFFDLYKKELDKRNYNYTILAGSGKLRFNRAVAAVNDLTKNTR